MDLNPLAPLTLSAILLLPALTWGAAPSVDEVLGKMDAAAPSFRTMTASLDRLHYTKVLDDKAAEKGAIRIRKQGRDLQAYINFTEPDPKVVAFRGRKAEMYLPKLQTIQEYDVGKQKSLVDQFLLMGFGTSGKELKANYTVALAGEQTIGGEKAWKLELTPLNAEMKQNLRKLELWVHESGAYPLRQQFVQPSGDYYLFTYSDVKLNPPLTDDDLRLKVPKGTKREDLRK